MRYAGEIHVAEELSSILQRYLIQVQVHRTGLPHQIRVESGDQQFKTLLTYLLPLPQIVEPNPYQNHFPLNYLLHLKIHMIRCKKYHN